MQDDLFDKREKPNGEIFLRYNREERLKHSSEKVRQMHDPNFIQRKGLIQSLTATPGLRFMLFAILIIIGLGFISLVVFGEKSSGKIYGIKIELKSFVYNGQILANIKLNKNEKMQINETIKVQFIFFDKDKNEIKSIISEGVYTGTDLIFSSQDESGAATKIKVNILLKDKILSLAETVGK